MTEWRRRPFFFAALLFSSVIAVFHPQDKNNLGPEGTIFVGGKIVSEVESREIIHGVHKDSFILDVQKRWDGFDSVAKDVRGKVRVSWKEAPALDYGDVLVLEGELAAFPGRRNPGGFDSKSYWTRRQISAPFYVPKNARYKTLARKQGHPVRAAAIAAKRALSARLSQDFEPRESAFLKALFLGERSDLDEDFKDLFLKTGTMHILAVSGFNIGFLCGVLWLFLKPFPLTRPFKLGLLLASAWVYCLIVGWQAPVVRATLMASIFLMGNMLGRKSDGLNALGLAACVILALNPLELFDVGFQLSFLAVLGLIVFLPSFLKREPLLAGEAPTLEDKTVFYFQELFWTSFVCYFLTLPLVVQNFYIVTPYALAANLLVVPLAFLLFFFALPYFIFPFLSFALKFVILVFVRGLYFIENLPGSVWVTGELAWPLAAVLSAGLLYLFWTGRFARRRTRVASIALLCGAVFLCQEALRLATRHFEMTMLDVGQGDSIYVEFPRGGNLLIDAGGGRFSDKGRWVVEPFLRRKGVRTLDGVVLSHPQEDHMGGLSRVLEDFRVKRVFHAGVPYESKLWERLQKEIIREKAEVTIVRRGDTIGGYPGESLRVLHPERGVTGEKNINEASIVLLLAHGNDSILLTGDIQEKAMHSLLASGQVLDADVLKVPHHGGKAGRAVTDFLEAVTPRMSLISNGARNPFGHPAPETLAALEGVPGNQILRTDRLGAIRLVYNGQRVVLDG